MDNRQGKATGRKVRAKVSKKKRNEPMALPVMRPDAAGIDIGAEEIWVAVPTGRDPQAVRRFGSFTADLVALADWLKRCGITTVAMESTGVYWIPLYQILAERKLEVELVNARHYQNVAGRPTDAGDCQWLQYLHSVGLVKGSFRPEQDICAVRTLLRHRDNLVKGATVLTQQLQKTLDQMNIKLHYVLSEVLGVSGMAILDALLGGERDLAKLAGFCHRSVKASRETVMLSLEGDYRPEHMFLMGQLLRMYRQQQDEISKLDLEMEKFMKALPAWDEETEVVVQDEHRKRKAKPRSQGGHGNAPAYDLAYQCARLAGVDLTAIPGFGAQTAQVILTEVGPHLSAFRSSSAFCSWLCLCPHNQITGGKVVSSRTRKSDNRAATALRLAAQTLHHSENHLGRYLRKMKSRLGKCEGITATAHKLARIVYHMLTTKEPFDDSVFAEQHQRAQQKNFDRLQRDAKLQGFCLVPMAPPPSPQQLVH